MKFRVAGLVTAFACVGPLAFAQQPLRLQITAGRVTLHAQNVPVRTILDEWARLGGAKVVNGDRVTAPAVTLDLENVSERQALDILLRGVSGYVLAARTAGTGASMYDRIMILPTSVAPRNPPPATATPVFNAPPVGAPRPGLVRPGIVPGTDGDDAADDNNDGGPLTRPVPIPRPNGAVQLGVPTGAPVIPPAPVVPETDQQPAAPPAVVSTPTNPFGLPAGSSSRPGVIAPAPQPQQAPPQAQQQRN